MKITNSFLFFALLLIGSAFSQIIGLVSDGNGNYVVLATSDDRTFKVFKTSTFNTWTEGSIQSPSNVEQFRSNIYYNNNNYYIFYHDFFTVTNTSDISTDGNTFTKVSMNAAVGSPVFQVSSAIPFAAIEENFNSIITSTDGMTWTRNAWPAVATSGFVVADGSIIVQSSKGSATVYYVSQDAKKWTMFADAVFGGKSELVLFSSGPAGTIVALVYTLETEIPNIFISTDSAVTWKSLGATVPGASPGLVYGLGYYSSIVIYSATNASIVFSTDLVHWTNLNPKALTVTPETFITVVDGKLFALINSPGQYNFAYTSNFIDWTPVAGPSPSINNE